MKKNEVITVGDINLNSIDWNKEVQERTDHDKSLDKLVVMLKEEILNKDTIKLNKEPTWNIVNNPKCIDHMYTNNPQKIKHFTTEEHIDVDHTIQILIREGQIESQGPMYIKTRKMKDFNNNDFMKRITEHPQYIEALTDKDPDEIAIKTQKILTEILDEIAPIKKIQIRQKR